jgi:hypothetical protein
MSQAEMRGFSCHAQTLLPTLPANLPPWRTANKRGDGRQEASSLATGGASLEPLRRFTQAARRSPQAQQQGEASAEGERSRGSAAPLAS